MMKDLHLTLQVQGIEGEIDYLRSKDSARILTGKQE